MSQSSVSVTQHLIKQLLVKMRPVILLLLLLLIKVFLKRRILFLETILSAYTCTHTHTHRDRGTRTHKHSDHTKLKTDPAQNGQQTPWRPGMVEDISTKQKTWQVYNFGKRNVFRLDLNESREGFCCSIHIQPL